MLPIGTDAIILLFIATLLLEIHVGNAQRLKRDTGCSYTSPSTVVGWDSSSREYHVFGGLKSSNLITAKPDMLDKKKRVWSLKLSAGNLVGSAQDSARR